MQTTAEVVNSLLDWALFSALVALIVVVIHSPVPLAGRWGMKSLHHLRTHRNLDRSRLRSLDIRPPYSLGNLGIRYLRAW
jgi:hypothetical protein